MSERVSVSQRMSERVTRIKGKIKMSETINITEEMLNEIRQAMWIEFQKTGVSRTVFDILFNSVFKKLEFVHIIESEKNECN